MIIENEFLRVEAEELGAQLKSIFGKRTNREYLWQGDPKYWTGRAYNLFPVIGRLYEGRYTLYRDSYEIPPHGLVRKRVLEAEQLSLVAMRFTLRSDDETMRSFPFPFVYTVTYRLEENTLVQIISVTNGGGRTMYYGIGGHPGFNIPFEGGVFEDYEVRFPNAEGIFLHRFSNDILMSGAIEPFARDGKLPLRHELFSLDAVVLSGTGGRAEIVRKGGSAKVVVDYPTMDYIGVWHKPQSDAPYVCLEPWTTLPGREGVVENFESKGDLLSLEAGETKRTLWSITIVE